MIEFEYKPDVRYLVSAEREGERKALLSTKAAGRQPITKAVREAAVLLLHGWTLEISGSDQSLYRIQPEKARPVTG